MLLDHEPLIMPLTEKNLQVAQRVASQSQVAAVQTKLYLNSLALQAATIYFQGLELPMSPKLADSDQAGWSLMTGSFDLHLTGLGSLECCAVLPGVTHAAISPESWENRIGYLIVEIDEHDRAAKILGFVKSANDRLEVPLSEIESLDSLLDYLEALEQNNSLASRLSQWLQAAELAAMKGWQLIEESLAPRNPQLAVRSLPITSNQLRFKRSLIISQDPAALDLVLALRPMSDRKVGVTISLRSQLPNQAFPEDLAVTMITDDNDQAPINLTPNATSKTTNGDLIAFSGSPGDRFSVLITTGDYTYSESFEI